MLLATRHKRTHPTLTPAGKAGTRLACPRGMEGWVDPVTSWCPIEPNASKVWRPNRRTTKRWSFDPLSATGALNELACYGIYVTVHEMIWT